MKIKALLTIISAVFLSCYQNSKITNLNSTKNSLPDVKNEVIDSTNIAVHYKTDKFDVAIFPKEYTEFLPEKRFTPNINEINKAESALETNLKEINKNRKNQSSSPIIDKNLNKYKRQYFGCIDENGKKYLLINCFWSDSENSQGWLNGIYIVHDGGSFYWEIKYYIEDNELKDLRVNGYA